MKMVYKLLFNLVELYCLYKLASLLNNIIYPKYSGGELLAQWKRRAAFILLCGDFSFSEAHEVMQPRDCESRPVEG